MSEPQVPERPRSERDEKEEKERGEKEEEKRDEKEEKSWEEKWRRDPLSAAIWAAILIWAGLVLLADNLGLFARLEALEAWSIILLGAGVLVIAEAVIRLLVPAYRRPIIGGLILGVILVAIGLGELVNWGVLWALILIALGAALLLRGLVWRR